MSGALQPRPASRLRMLGRAADHYAEEMLEVSDWLEARGIDLSTASRFRLGVVTDPFPGHEMYRGRLCIPYINASGDVSQLRFRCLRDHNCHESGCPKYMTMAGDDVQMFNLGALTTTDTAMSITEGEFDAMILTQLGLPAMAAPGVSTWAPRHSVMCGGFDAVYVWGDGDKAGRTFNDTLTRLMDNARPVSMPEGCDISDVYVDKGKDAVLELLATTERLYA